MLTNMLTIYFSFTVLHFSFSFSYEETHLKMWLLANKDHPFKKSLNANYRSEVAHRKRLKQNKPKGNDFFGCHRDEKWKRIQVSCQQFETQISHEHLSFWLPLNDSEYLAALGLHSCISATCWSCVVVAAFKNGKLCSGPQPPSLPMTYSQPVALVSVTFWPLL